MAHQVVQRDRPERLRQVEPRQDLVHGDVEGERPRGLLLQDHQDEVALEEAGRGPGLGGRLGGGGGVGGAVEATLARAGALELLCLDPKLGRVHP